MIRTLAIALLCCACVPVGPPRLPPPPHTVDGVRVRYEWSDVLAGTAGATWRGRTPTILLHPTRSQSLTPAQAAWVLEHELAHLEGAPDEITADCWATLRLAARGLLTVEAVDEIAAHLRSGTTSERHPPAEHRVAAVRRCAP